MHRVLDHYLHAAIVASALLYPYHAEVTRAPPQPGVMLERIGGPAQAAEWFENEQQVLLAVIRPGRRKRLRSVRLGAALGRRVVFPGQGVLAKARRGPGSRAGGRRQAGRSGRAGDGPPASWLAEVPARAISSAPVIIWMRPSSWPGSSATGGSVRWPVLAAPMSCRRRIASPKRWSRQGKRCGFITPSGIREERPALSTRSAGTSFSLVTISKR